MVEGACRLPAFGAVRFLRSGIDGVCNVAIGFVGHVGSLQAGLRAASMLSGLQSAFGALEHLAVCGLAHRDAPPELRSSVEATARDVAVQASEGSRQVTAASQSLARLATELQGMVRQFRTD
ncbi:hypothetical protein D3C85_1286360 [compost metagenome]